jgi:uncharacterized protein (DUF885 family)
MSRTAAASGALAALASAYWEFQRHESPIAAILAGEPLDNDVLLREAPADHERRKSWAQGALRDLESIDHGSLDPEDRTTRSLLRRELELLVEVAESGACLRPPLYPVGPDYALQSWASSTVIETPAEARAYLVRLQTYLRHLRDFSSR